MKKGRGRPKKVTFADFTVKNVLAVIFLVLSIIINGGLGVSLDGDFRYCDTAKLARVDIENTCQLRTGNSRFFEASDGNKTFYLLDKMSHMVQGIGKECSKSVAIKRRIQTFSVEEV